MASDLTSGIAELLVAVENRGGTSPGYATAIRASGSMSYCRWNATDGAMQLLTEHHVQAGPDFPANVLVVDAAGNAFRGTLPLTGGPVLAD